VKNHARDYLFFGFNYIFIHIQPIRQIDHPFIPLSFHWNTSLNTLIYGTCTNLWLFEPAGFTDFSEDFAQELKVFPLYTISEYPEKNKVPRYILISEECIDMPVGSPVRSLHL
jgi:hypothetical protein